MLLPLNSQDLLDRDAIIADIYSAFGNVTRGPNAISWNETVAIDDYESAVECARARKSDTDRHWQELVDNPNWKPFPGIGGFGFINLEGFRYYLPPTLIRFLRDTAQEWFPNHLLGIIGGFIDIQSHTGLTPRQFHVVARFIEFMSKHDGGDGFDDEGNVSPHHARKAWENALNRGWRIYLTDPRFTWKK